MQSTPSAVHVQRVMRETTVRSTPMTVIPTLVKMGELVMYNNIHYCDFAGNSLYTHRIWSTATCVFVRQGGLGKGAVLTLTTVLLILARMVEPALWVYKMLTYFITSIACNPTLFHPFQDLIADYFCACPPGWIGKNCEVERDECSNRCENATDPCFPQPCQNGATCSTVLGNDYHCTCPKDFDVCSFKKTHKTLSCQILFTHAYRVGIVRLTWTCVVPTLVTTVEHVATLPICLNVHVPLGSLALAVNLWLSLIQLQVQDNKVCSEMSVLPCTV